MFNLQRLGLSFIFQECAAMVAGGELYLRCFRLMQRGNKG